MDPTQQDAATTTTTTTTTTTGRSGATVDEREPLLGRPGDASQEDGKGLWYNLILGTAPIAQFGIFILTGIVWGSVLSSKLMLFSAHPLLNSAGILFTTQAILILQPTHTAAQKKTGTYTHALLNDASLMLLIAGLVVIEYNKISHGGQHFRSPHAILGLATYGWMFLQALVGFTAYFTPMVYGSRENAKRTYRWHRASGYVLLVLMFATVAAATRTDFAVKVLEMNLWAVVVAGVVTLVGVVPRVKRAKFGL